MPEACLPDNNQPVEPPAGKQAVADSWSE